MYICPTCGREYESDEMVAKHFLTCWKEKNNCPPSKAAPRTADIETRTVNTDMANFFAAFQKGDKHE